MKKNKANLQVVSNNISVYMTSSTLINNICKDITSQCCGCHYRFSLNRCMFMKIINKRVLSTIAYRRKSNIE